MSKALTLYNSLTRQKEVFEPLEPGFVGMYVCGPTVYSDVHLGNVMTFVRFDLIYRYLKYAGYKVRYVRNITDVGHLLDDGEDRISKGARANKLEPMEVVQKYTVGFHEMMQIFNVLPPSIEPRATGHIIEQIEMVQQIIDNGYGYEKNGSVYFDVPKFAKDHPYGALSGRKIDELLAETRDLKNQSEKRHPSDFAIWMNAADEHLMKWNSPWGVGFPGWHLECSAMSTKYLGKQFDIHGGGNDLKFPHHENEIAQNLGSCSCTPARYWLHTNMLLMNGRKMSKSDGNTITPEQLLSGDSPHITQAYTPMGLRFFMLQSHYRSTLDMTNEGLLAADKAYRRMCEALGHLNDLKSTSEKGALDETVTTIMHQVFDHMNDDFNTPRAIASLWELVPHINGTNVNNVSDRLGKETLELLQERFGAIFYDIFGLEEEKESANSETVDALMQLIIDLRNTARADKNWAVSDTIRDGLQALNIQLKDGKDGTNWTYQ